MIDAPGIPITSPEHICGDDLHFDLTVQIMTDSNIKFLEVSGNCKHCGRRLAFRGRFGINPGFPTVAIDGSEVVVPFLLEGDEYDGKMAGYDVSVGGAN